MDLDIIEVFYGEDLIRNNIISQRDAIGYGTHTTTTTVSEKLIGMISMLSSGQGPTSGGALSKRITLYKACWFDGCKEVDILAAFDDVIVDGVDIILVSVRGKEDYSEYFRYGFSIGAFHAMKNEILIVFALGNSCPQRSFLTSFPPWAIVVVATESTLDRKFVAEVRLEDSKKYEEISYFYPMVDIPLFYLPLLKNKESHKNLIY